MSPGCSHTCTRVWSDLNTRSEHVLTMLSRYPETPVGQRGLVFVQTWTAHVLDTQRREGKKELEFQKWWYTSHLTFVMKTTCTDFFHMTADRDTETQTHTHLDVASKGVVAVELTHIVSVAGVFHLSIDENISWKQSHFSTHVHPVYDLSYMAVQRLPWAAQRQNVCHFLIAQTDAVQKYKGWTEKFIPFHPHKAEDTLCITESVGHATIVNSMQHFYDFILIINIQYLLQMKSTLR